MSSLFESTYNPDVLSCIANLSNDEVFTPPELANKMLDMLPGVSNNKNVDLQQSEKEFAAFEAIIQSMTKAERENPQILNASRRRRIAAGSGQPVQKINQLVKRYEEARKMMKSMMSPRGSAKLNRMFGGLR